MSSSFEEKLESYADLAVHVGVGLQKGQRLTVRASVEAPELVRKVVASAYKAGASLVEVLWADDATRLARFQYAPRDSFDLPETASGDAVNAAAERGDAFLAVYASDPDLLKDQDPDLVAKAQRAQQMYVKSYFEKIVSNRVNWSIVAAPIPGWAACIFPDDPPERQTEKLWDAILKAVRVDQPDPVAAWKAHAAELAARRDYLTAKQYTTLAYDGPGTELTVGLPHGHIWRGGGATTESGIPFIANMPTEEVFSLPDRARVDGVVTSTKPLSYAGTLIKNFRFHFESGQITKIEAEQGQSVLQKLVETDEGSTRLGEVALVPNSSPISASGLLFYNTLFDENAASHLAIGKAYRHCLEGGIDMSDADFEAAGGNNSLAHVDFMIGSAEVNIDGITRDGAREPVMRNGEWAFDV